jgi:hypothetical protein
VCYTLLASNTTTMFHTPPKLVKDSVSQQFATVVIEVPRPSYFKQTKAAMCVASLKAGGANYRGPQRLYPPRWKHIQTIYVFDLSANNYYQAQSLTNHPHYSILPSELLEFEHALEKYRTTNRSIKIKRIQRHENYSDPFLIVINNFKTYPVLQNFVASVDDATLLPELFSKCKLDVNRGNWKMDFGYSSGQNLERDMEEYGVTRPRLLDRTKEPVFAEVQKELSVILDMTSDIFQLPKYHRQDDIDKVFAASIHPLGLYTAWRVAAHGPNAHVQIHEDSLNESRPMMSPVGVLSRIYEINGGPIRLTKIGYSRQSLLEAIRREQVFKPIVKEFKDWESTQPALRANVSSELLKLLPNSDYPDLVEIPCHLERSVGVSPYIHATVELQRILGLSRHQCVAIVYNCVTNESPFYFYSVYKQVCLMDERSRCAIARKSPTEIGLWYHSMMWKMIRDKSESGDTRTVPHRHQPHNGKGASDLNIAMSIVNLIRMTDEFNSLEEKEVMKQYPHSKAIAILSLPAKKGGCHACGGLTSQTLLYTLACIGLIPICVTRWGELAGTDTAGFLERHYGLGYSDGRGQQFLSCCVAASPGKDEQQIENRLCKWTRHKKEIIEEAERAKKKRRLGKTITKKKNKCRFKDGIWVGQSLYNPVGNILQVFTATGNKRMRPPAYSWPQTHGKKRKVEGYWDQTTRQAKKRVLGGNRRAKKGRIGKATTISRDKLRLVIPSPTELCFQTHTRPLFLSINNLLRDVLEEEKPIPNRRILANSRRRKNCLRFQLLDQSDVLHDCSMVTRRYSVARDCKLDGALHFARAKNLPAFSKYIFGLISGQAAAEQVANRDASCGEYMLIHDNNGRTRGKLRVIALAKYITRTRLVFVHVNSQYQSDEMDYCFLDKV